jgi:hypothetical protein
MFLVFFVVAYTSEKGIVTYTWFSESSWLCAALIHYHRIWICASWDHHRSVCATSLNSSVMHYILGEVLSVKDG